MQRPKFALFGDSLTQKASDPQGGWAAALAHGYQRKVGCSCRNQYFIIQHSMDFEWMT